MADLLQITRGTSATIRETFYLDGAPSDLDGGVGAVPVVTITKPDGTTIASGTVTRISTGLFSFVLAAQAQCTLLRVAWVGTIGGQVQTLVSTVEVIGAELFGIKPFRDLRVANGTPFAASGVSPIYSDTQIRDTRAAILDEMTDVLGYSPVPRFARETHDGGSDVVLHQHHATNLLSLTLAGTSQLITGYYLHPSGVLRPVTNYIAGPTITRGLGNVTVEYVHGTSRVPGNGSHVAMLWAAAQLNPSGFSSASTVSMPDGSTYTYEPSVMGRDGYVRHTGISEVDRWLNRHAESMAA